jgi:hypothetical protein
MKFYFNKNSSMFEVNYRVWCAWTFPNRAHELPVVVKIKFDLNKILTFSRWTAAFGAPELPQSRSWTSCGGKN